MTSNLRASSLGHAETTSTSAMPNDGGNSSEMLAMKILPGHGPRPVSRRGDTSSTISPSSLSPTESLNSLDRSHTDNFLLPNPPDSRPKWLKESSARSRQTIDSLLKVPGLSNLMRWLSGPSQPRPYTIKPFFAELQSWLPTVVSKYISPTSGATLIASSLCVLWLILFSLLLVTTKTRLITDGNGPVRLDCVTKLWDNATACGLDGRMCQPFQGANFSFVCPSNCASVQVLEPHTIGDEEIIYRNMVIGGPSAINQNISIYRGDSFICPAAIHAGIVSNSRGGCGMLKREGEQKEFTSSEHNGISSIAFQPSFPLSFSLISLERADCRDPQWALFAVSMLSTIGISLMATPPKLLFSSIFVITFFQVALASDSPYFPDYASTVSLTFERFLPAAFVGVVLYRYCVSRTLKDLKAYWERTILWVGGCWMGALNVYTFDQIPISRLTLHDLRQQPGAITALIVILGLIVAATIGQIWAFRIEGRLSRYVGFYLIVALIVGCLLLIPGLNLRIHHYIIGLLLLPGTSIQTRPSLIYQGILLGLFINGVARWGFASILQTPAALRGDGQLGSALPMNLVPDIVANTIEFTIAKLADGFDGISVLVNDVERYQAANLSLPVVFNWTRTDNSNADFFRFAFTGTYTLGGAWYGDYTKPGTWFANGTWKGMLPGPSR